MQMTDGPMQGYFRWSCKTDGTPNAQGPASDGELYYITSLLFASNLWGNETGINYLGEAQHILDAIQPKTIEVKINRDRQGNLLKEPITMSREVSLIDTATNLITFVPGVPYTDPSYHLPAFYEVWARYAQDGRSSYWQECARASREYLHRSIDGATGLNPDYNNFDGSLLRNGHLIGDAFRYDSWRVPMNIALDYSWSCADRVWQQNYGHLIQNFLYSQGLDTFVDQYNVDGTRPERLLRAGNYPEALRHSIGLVATSAAVSLVCTHAKAYEFVDAFWNARHEPDESGYFDAYYDGLLRLFAFMHLSGRYRVIERTMQFSQYFAPATETGISPDEQGFLHRWKLAEPLSRPNASNTLFTDTYLRDMLQWDPKQQLTWHHLDSKLYNVKLFRFATCQELPYYGVLFWVETVIDCPEEIRDVRLSVGSNSASRWWLDGEEVLMLSGDRRMVQDDAMSHRLTLHKGRNVLRGAIINGPGMSDFCVRFIDESGSPVLNYSIR
jgi:oligosaccharide reducing-end xylanase